MREIWFERTTTAILRDAFRFDSQVANAPSAEPPEASAPDRLPYWLHGEKSQATGFSPYDLRKTSEGAQL
jgi:hypothetical protein